MKKKVLISLRTSAICASIAVTVNPLTAFASTNRPALQQKSIALNGKVVSKPSAVVHDGTTYVPIWYIMQALDNANIHSTWKSPVWNLSTSHTPNVSDLHVDNGSSSIYINGTFVQRINQIVNVDPSSGNQTTYMPIWYIMQILNCLGIKSQWNGTTWNISNDTQILLTDYEVSSPSAVSGQQIVSYAKQFIGTPYQMGGESSKGFDCSGLVQTVFAHFGISLPRTAADQAQIGQTIAKSNLQPGDLVFFNTDGQEISHVGIYVGNSQFISATSSQGVQIRDLNDPYYWGPLYVKSTNPGI